MDIDPTRTRLLELAEQHGASLAALSQMIGRNSSYLQQFVRKGSPRKLEEYDRARLARFFGVDEAELRSDREISYDPPGWAGVRRLNVGVSAGAGALSGSEGVVGTLRFSEQWLREMGLRVGQLSAVTVQGDSMEPTLRHGDELLVDTSSAVAGEGIWVVRLGDAVLVKRLETARTGVITLLSDNRAYRPVECRPEEVCVIGRAVWKGGRI